MVLDMSFIKKSSKEKRAMEPTINNTGWNSEFFKIFSLIKDQPLSLIGCFSQSPYILLLRRQLSFSMGLICKILIMPSQKLFRLHELIFLISNLLQLQIRLPTHQRSFYQKSSLPPMLSRAQSMLYRLGHILPGRQLGSHLVIKIDQI